MWKFTEFDGGSVPSIYAKEVALTYSAKTTHVEADLCRDPNCSVRHIFPIDVVFSVRNKGTRKKWTRHMSELTAQAGADGAGSGIPVENAWTGLHNLMKKQGTYVKPGELERYWTISDQGKTMRQFLQRGESNGLITRTAQIYVRAFEHLMFDSAYVEALRSCIRTGTISDSLVGKENFRVGYTCLIVPRFLTPELQDQWIADVTALTSYALEKGLGTEPPAAPSSPPSNTDAQRDANKQLYQVNKELASAIAVMEARLDRMRVTLGSLTTKIEEKKGERVSGSVPVERLSAALRLLLLSQSPNDGEDKESDSAEVTLLSNQLKTVNAANATLQKDLVDLQNNLKEVRQQKKDRVKTEKNK